MNGGLFFAGTQVITSARNLVNVGTITSGAITSSGTITTSGSLVAATAVISNITANGSGSNILVKNNGGSNIARFNNDLSTDFFGAISSGDITITDTSTDPFLKLATSERQYVVRIDNSDSDKFQIRDVTASVTRLSIDTSGNATFSNGLTVEGTTTFNDDVSFTNDALFGDNDKAIFGSGS